MLQSMGCEELGVTERLNGTERKNLLNSTRSSTRRPVMACMGREPNPEWE